MLVAGLDFETTGLDLKEDRVIEVGAVLWCTDRRAPVRIFSELINVEDLRPITPELTAIHGITPEDVRTYGKPSHEVFLRLTDFISSAQALVAHNGKRFDFPLYWAELRRFDGIRFSPEGLLFVDTSVDVEYPPKITTRKLTHLAAEHGFLNPFSHRAVFDTLTMMQVLSHYDWEQVCENARTPDLLIQAVVSFDKREEAKSRGFRWDGEKKAWLKVIKAPKITEVEEYPFRCAIIETIQPQRFV